MNVIELTSPLLKKDSPIRLAAYCRVSSDSEDQLHSFAAQIRYYMDYSKKHPQYKLVDIYADEGLTGTSMEKREELARLFRDCKSGKVDRIIVKSVSRFARNTEELLTALRMLKGIGISVYFEEQDIDTDKLNMEMIVTFPGMAAQQESESISGNVRWSYKKRMESGDFNCNYPAYGYKIINGQMQVNEAEAAVVRQIFDLYLQGVGKQRIATLLNAEEVHSRHGTDRWCPSTIDYILNNERYMGDALLQKRYTTETLPFKRMKNGGEQPQYYVENSNPPIVSREIYQKVQEFQKLKQRYAHKRQLTPLAKVMRCSECGHTLRRQTVNGTAYWLCSYQAVGRSNCQSHRVQEEMIYAAFSQMLEKLIEYRKPLIGVLIKQMEMMLSKTGVNTDRIHRLDKEIADLATQNLVITQLHTKGILNAAEFSTQSAEINGQISGLRIERRKRLSESNGDETLDELKTLDSTLAECELQDGFNEELFEQIVKSITVENSAELTFHLIGDIALTETICEKGRCHVK